MNMRKIIISILLLLPMAVLAQKFTEYDRRVFNEGQFLRRGDVELAPDDVSWDPINPLKLYSINNKGDETIVIFSYSILSDSQWVTFSKGIYIEDDDSGDVYKVRGYMDGLTMDRLLIIKGCRGENVLVPLRFPKLKRKVKSITIHSPGHEDDIKPTNSKGDKNPVLASKAKVKEYRDKHRLREVFK